MQISVLKILQLSAEIFLTTFFADIVTFYLSLELITYHSISATNLASRHADRITVMNKNILHVCCIEFILDVFDTDLNHATKLKMYHVIQHYKHDKNVRELIMTQKNKINMILIIQNFE
jgi:hypothetical protein